ncbi:zinc finger and BTB domain-containing protein 46 isoform X1 [Megalops cyprinoides]|uniref:zinc finger and BTB domain-containing protein 46 isoform X1 n=1 Tax=Megalops cyprinoides TaxID=118141 RepID=UPI001864CE01|nr:zinc finger and BTB domain-containing protein 46 isoform X1 [Megalops cyprinoides]
MNNRKEDMEITSHYRQLLRELNEQRQHGILCDVCVIVEGKIFKAHKNVLLGSSRYFKTLYCQVKKGSEQQATITHLDIVTAQGFKTILDFMYSAHLALTSKNVIEVMSAASYLQMTDIVQACHNFIKAALDISIRSELADELADFEMGAAAVGGAGGGGAEALASMMLGRSSSPWLARRTSPANSSGDSAIASCHEGGSNYGKEDQEPKSHESQEDVSSQPLWPGEFRSVQVKEEQVSPLNFKDGPTAGTQGTLAEQASGESWQPLGSGRRKNRKNKDTVRHITQQAEGDSRAGSPLPSILSASGWSYNNQDIPGADVIEPNSSDSRGDRLDFFVKQEEALAGDPGFLSQSLAAEKDDPTCQAASVANLRAALMSKNSLLSLRAEMLGEDNPLLFEYLPKTGHSLSRPGSYNSSSNRPGGKFDSKQGASSPPPPPPLHPPDGRPSGPSSLLQAGGVLPERPAVEETSDPSPTEEKMQCEEDIHGSGTGLDGSQPPKEEDQMALVDKSSVVAREPPGGGSSWPQELACSLCKRLFGSLDQLREHEYKHTLSLMALSLDCFDMQRPLTAEPPARYFCSQCPASFTLKSNADRHEKTIHFKRKMMQCAYCLKHFRDRTDLNRHLSSVHSSERVFACPVCGKAFSTQKNLATHAKVCCQAGGASERLWDLHPLKSEDAATAAHTRD